MPDLALYTTVYPGVEKFLADWYRSVLAQTDGDFQVWIGLDLVDAAATQRAMGGRLDARWVTAAPGESPAQVRQRALELLCGENDAVVLVDSDDVLLPTRVATARRMLGSSDLAGCPLRLVDQAGANLDLTFELPPGMAPDEAFPRNNIFGLSNSAYSCGLLHRCLPIPAEVELVDWFLATRAWLFGARMAFGEVPEMEYRQHAANMVRVAPPFDSRQVANDSRRVLHHFRLVAASDPAGAAPDRLAALRRAAVDVELFYERVALDPPLLKRYVGALNAAEIRPLWWSSVANQSLRDMWASTEECV